MKNPVASRSITLWILLVLIFILAIGAIISGAMLFLAPDGHIMQMQVDVLSDSPFPGFLFRA